MMPYPVPPAEGYIVAPSPLQPDLARVAVVLGARCWVSLTSLVLGVDAGSIAAQAKLWVVGRRGGGARLALASGGYLVPPEAEQSSGQKVERVCMYGLVCKSVPSAST